jgi:hypothetical protein
MAKHRRLNEQGKPLSDAVYYGEGFSKKHPERAFVVRVTVSSGCWRKALDGKMTYEIVTTVYGTDAKKCLAVAQKDFAERKKYFVDHHMLVPDYRAVTMRQLKNIDKKKQENVKERRAGAGKRAAATRKKRGTKATFILCPTCRAKSKKLFSEMGGLQTRRCQNGHNFEVDVGAGLTEGRRVERTDRPFYVGPGMSYTEYVYGQFMHDPDGKGSAGKKGSR